MATTIHDGSQPPPSPYLTCVSPDLLIRNALIASYQSEPPGTGLFTLFSSLPVELRVKVWQHAISVPRIVGMEKVPCWEHESLNSGRSYFADRWHYRIRNPPPLLSTCVESRREALKAYQTHDNLNAPKSNPPWIRYDYDILHLKARRWDEQGQQVAHMWSEYDVRGWNYPGGNVSDGHYSPKRECFKKVEAMAINRELFSGTTNDYVEVLVRRTFPNLKLLIILIDDEIDIETAWEIKNHSFSPYEIPEANPGFVRRWAFTAASTGPFTLVSSQNSWYRYDVEYKMHRYFTREKVRIKSFVPPYVVVMGCALPKAMEIPSCGRLPV
ncbi:hypothetical protein LSUE1_G001893 [Lachnellula suecica]|uniref:2EXR domain-containing protein n=1 Tax=Lachnellula suecica TaxID=602035 RepID=A0A8T9CAZ7_9HELO|nr:hypothetical protein LSUE1_G001893 [Lachnellula suecica]